MCIIVVVPSVNSITSEVCDVDNDTLRNCWKNNDDGAGYMFTHNQNIILKKGFFSFKKFLKSYRMDRKKYKDTIFVCHFRIASRGTVNVDNCHPHWIIDNKLAVAHNGTFMNSATADGDSDTKVFIDTILKNLPNNWIDNAGIRTLLSMAVNKNKLVFMTQSGNVYITNYNDGVSFKGIWFSNTSYIQKAKVVTPVVETSFNKKYEYVCEVCKKKKQGYISEYTASKCWDCMDNEEQMLISNNIYGEHNMQRRIYCKYCNTSLQYKSERDMGICIHCLDKTHESEFNGQQTDLYTPSWD